MSSEPDVIESNSFSIVCPCCSTILVVCRSALPAPQHHSDPQRDETGWWFSCSQCNYRWWYRSDFIEESSNSHEKIETIQTLKKLLNEFSDDSADAFSFSSSAPFSHPVDQLISDAVKDLAPTQKTEESKQLHASVSENSHQNPPSASAPEIDETIIENIKTQILSEVKTELDSYQKSIQQQANIQNPLFDPKSVPSHIRKIGSAFFPQKKTHTKHPSPQNHPAPKTRYSYKRVLPSNFSVQNIHPEKSLIDASPQSMDSSNTKPPAQAKEKSVFFPKILSSLKGIHLSSPFHPSAKAAPLHPSLVSTEAPSASNPPPETEATLSSSNPPISAVEPDIHQTAPTPLESKVPSQNIVIPGSKTPPLHPSLVSTEAPSASNPPPETEATLSSSNPPISAVEPDIHQEAPVSSNSKIKVPDKNTVITYSNFKANISNTSFRKYPLFSLIDDKPVHFIKKEINIQTYSTYPKQIVQSPKKVFTSSLSENEFKPKNAFVAASSPQTQLMEPQARKAPTLNPSPLNDYDGDTIKELYEQPLEQEPPLDADPIETPEIPVKKSMFSWFRARKHKAAIQFEEDSLLEPVNSESAMETPAAPDPAVEESIPSEPAIAETHEEPSQPPLDADPIATPEIPAKKSMFSWFRARKHQVAIQFEEDSSLKPANLEPAVEALEAPEPAVEESIASEPAAEAPATPEPAVEESILSAPAIAETHEEPSQSPLEADPIETPEIPVKKSLFSWFRARKHKVAIQFEEDSSLKPANLEPAVEALEAPDPAVEESIPSEPAIAETHEEPSQSPLDADPVETPEIPIKKSLFSWWRTRKRQVAIQFEEDSSLKPANLEPAVEALEAPEPAVEESIPSEPAVAETHEEPSQSPLDADPIPTPEIPVKKSKFSWLRVRKHKAAIQFEEDSLIEPANSDPATEELATPEPAVEESIPSEPAVAEIPEELLQTSLEADPIATPEIPQKKSLFSRWRARRSSVSAPTEAIDSSDSSIEPLVEESVTSEPALDEPIREEPAIAEVHEQPLQREPPLDADPIETPEIPVKKSLFSWWRTRKRQVAIQFEEDSLLEPANSDPATEELATPEPVIEESIPSEPAIAETHEEPSQPPLEADPIETPEIPIKKSKFSWFRARKHKAAIQFEEDSSLKPANLEPAVKALEAPEPAVEESIASEPAAEAPATPEPVVEESIPSEPAIAETHEEPSQSPLDADPVETPEIPVKKSMFSWFRARKHKAAIQFEEDSSLEPANSDPATEELATPEPANSPAVEESITSEPAAETPAAPDPAMIEAVHAQLSQQEPPLNTDPIPMPKISAKKQRVFTFSLDPFLQKKSPFQAHPAKSMDASTLQLQSTSKQPSKQVANLPHQAHTVSTPALPKPSPFKSVQFHFSSAIFLKKKRKPKVSIELRANHLSSVLDPLPQFSESISLSNQTSKRIKVALRSNIESKLTKNIKPYIAIKEESHHPIVIPFEHEETIVLPPLIPMLHPKKPELRAQNFSHHSLKIIDCPKIPASEPRVADSSRALRIILFMSSLSFITTGSIFITNQYKETGLELWKRNVFYAHSHSLSTPLLLKEATYSILEGTPTNKLLIVGEVTNPNDHSAKMCSISIKVYAQNNRSKPLYAWNYFHFTTHILPKEHILFRTEKEVHIPLDADLHIEVELVP